MSLLRQSVIEATFQRAEGIEALTEQVVKAVLIIAEKLTGIITVPAIAGE